MVGKIHKKKISEYTEAAENDDKLSDRGDEAEEEMILDHVDPVPSGSESENGDVTNNEHKSLDSNNANDDAGVNDDVATGLNYDTDYNSAAEAEEDEAKKGKKRKATKKATDIETDDEPLNGGSPKKKSRKLSVSGGKGKSAAKAKGAKAKKAAHKDEDDDEGGDDEEEYEVKDIVGHKTERGVSYFLIRWKGYTKADDTWEPEDTLSCPDIIERYKKKQKQSSKKGSSPAKKKGPEKKGATGKGNKKPVDEEQEWEVEKIIDYAEEKKGRVFRIRWKGFGPKNDTWEPEANLNCDDIIQKFLSKMKSQENVSFKELREEPKKTKRLVNETAPRTNIHNPIGRKSKRAITKKRVFYGDMDD